MDKLDDFEKEMLEAIESGKFRKVSDIESELESVKSAASNYVKKTARINVRLTPCDFQGIKTRALEEGIPYQTLISSVIHKYVNGSLVDKGHIGSDDV